MTYKYKKEKREKKKEAKFANRGKSSSTDALPKRVNTRPYKNRPKASADSSSTAPVPASASASNTESPKNEPSKKKQQYEKSASSLPGVPGASKIKSSIRQTKRLLAKDNLAPGTKIEAERRLKSLEADLEVATKKQMEKSRASKYHQVKFVERQKLVRRIARCKRNLGRLESGKMKAETDSEDGDSDNDDDDDQEFKVQRVIESKMSAEQLTQLLKQLRQLLQYVVQYPAELRYVALFPHGEQGPKIPDAKESDKSRQKAYEHLVRVQKAMDSGELSGEPEEELSSQDRPRTKLAHDQSAQVDNGKDKKDKRAKKDNKASENKRKRESSDQDDAGGIAGDDFFAQNSDDE
ncbi:related to rRNA-processing protein EFG1 [Melanopsichium pennsylvanicum]|uniref:rRNA-processing protein EFG1 n=2 Tax=Melanopsichium pennsylvanicum TaxID=63383 RepID=A0AAJ5C3B2_9BASI|nr:conserved hypothetical protein [Melanopsichium pennsylvanicum 4]SNX82397.1 related to rRNA-processing protein EFG1 [Melanopsichium pennsylvanicum]